MVCVCVGTFDNLCFFMNETLPMLYNAVGIEQDMGWTKILGKLCVCKYISQSFFFMNETLCYNAIAIEQDMAWTTMRMVWVCV